MAASELNVISPVQHGPLQSDLDKCVHCGLCLNACPTYRELGVEMDSPRGRIYQMNAVANGAPVTPEYERHLDLCLACRGCETACPSGVPYGRLIEAARSTLEKSRRRSPIAAGLRSFLFDRVINSRAALQAMGAGLFLYQTSGLQTFIRKSGVLNFSRKLTNLEALCPDVEPPFFFRNIGRTFPAIGPRRYRVAFVAGCIANVAFARMNDASIRVLQNNGCEVVIPATQNCCGALHLHSGLLESALRLARRNVVTFGEEYDAIITNAAGCGSTLKEYGSLLAEEPEFAAQAQRFTAKMQDINQFLASIDLNADMTPVHEVVTYQDSCHLAHGQKISAAPRQLLHSIPGLTFREMPNPDLCCGSAGVYNIAEDEMALRILQRKMETINLTKCTVIATANPGCILQLRTGARLFGQKQRVAHVVELLDQAYGGTSSTDLGSESHTS
jgi:glycolate oxidase iron-sulfur subunit